MKNIEHWKLYEELYAQHANSKGDLVTKGNKLLKKSVVICGSSNNGSIESEVFNGPNNVTNSQNKINTP